MLPGDTDPTNCQPSELLKIENVKQCHSTVLHSTVAQKCYK